MFLVPVHLIQTMSLYETSALPHVRHGGINMIGGITRQHHPRSFLLFKTKFYTLTLLGQHTFIMLYCLRFNVQNRSQSTKIKILYSNVYGTFFFFPCLHPRCSQNILTDGPFLPPPCLCSVNTFSCLVLLGSSENREHMWIIKSRMNPHVASLIQSRALSF